MDPRFLFDPSLMPPPVTGPLERPVLPEDAVMYCPRLDFPTRPGEPTDSPVEVPSDPSAESDSPVQQPLAEELDSRFGW